MSGSFTEIGISAELAKGLGKAGITVPTPIQSAVIPQALAGKDIIGQSPTGSGKTFAYLLPLLQRLDPASRDLQVVILAPTHELAMQIYHQIGQLAKDSCLPVAAAPIIGKVNINRQIEALKSRPQVIVGSSGRILELIQKRKINSQTVRAIVLDEADKLLDDANVNGVRAVIKTTMKDRQLLLFSATITPAALQRAKEFAHEPVIVAPAVHEVPHDIEHLYFVAEQRDKIEVLRKLAVHLNLEKALAFINQSDAVETMVAKLNYHGLAAAGIYGTAGKSDRQKALKDFRDGNVRLLVASDLAARGLDITGVSYVISLEMPDDPAAYLHRVGRTGRAGQSGVAISIFTPKEAALVGKLERTLNIKLSPRYIAKGKIFDSVPKAAKNPKQKEIINVRGFLNRWDLPGIMSFGL